MKGFLSTGLFALGAMLGEAALALPPAPVFTPSTSFLDFGSMDVGATSQSMTVVVSNTGNAALAISSVLVQGTNLGDYTLAPAADDCASVGSVAPSGACTISLTFTPQGTGASSAWIIVTDNTVGGTEMISLSGEGLLAAAPALALSATSLAFANETVNTTSAPQALTLTNSGTAPLNVTNVAVSGADMADFMVVGNTCQGAALPANASCTVAVTFTPGAGGDRLASLDITSDAAATPAQVTLIGTAAAVPAPALSLVPDPAFGNVNVGATSGTQTVTLTNTGTAPLSITGVQVTGPGFLESSTTCGASLAPNASCAVGVAFAPIAAGPASGSLTVTSNAPGSLSTVALSGTGVDPAPLPAVVSLTPAQLVFAPRHVHTNGTRQVTVTNTGTGPMNIKAVNISGPQAADFRALGNCPIGGTLPAQQSCTITVTFTPSDTGARAATLTLVSDATGANTVSLSGIGTRRHAHHHHDGDHDRSSRHGWDHDHDHDGKDGAHKGRHD